MSGQAPTVRLRRGAVSLAAWCETGQDGKPWWKTVKLQRSWKDKQSGEWRYGDIGGNDAAEAILLLQAFHLKHMISEPDSAGRQGQPLPREDVDVPY